MAQDENGGLSIQELDDQALAQEIRHKVGDLNKVVQEANRRGISVDIAKCNVQTIAESGSLFIAEITKTKVL